jgi:hypothetical protein
VEDLALVHHVYPNYSEGVKAAAEQALTKSAYMDWSKATS